jgi:hypothetical protein
MCTDEFANCDFGFFENFLSKFKIFQNQLNEFSLNQLIENELQVACEASPKVANYIYKTFEDSLKEWCRRSKEVEWLEEKSEPWQKVVQCIITEIKKLSVPEIQEIKGCGIGFSKQYVQKLSDAIEKYTVVNIVTKSNTRILHKLKTNLALKNSGYKNVFFCGKKSFLFGSRVESIWPCKWSRVFVLDWEFNTDQSILDELLQTENFIDNMRKNKQKLIIISAKIKDLNLPDDFLYFEDEWDIRDLDENSKKQILEKNVNFQGICLALSQLVYTDPLDSKIPLLNSDIISTLLSYKHELTVGRLLSDVPKYHVPRILQHRIHLKEDILKLPDKEITFAVSGLQAHELKDYLPDDEKICEFVYDESGSKHKYNLVSDFSKNGLSVESEEMKTHQKEEEQMKSEHIKYNNLGNKSTEGEVIEGSKVNSFSVATKVSNSGSCDKLENKEPHLKEPENTKPNDARYIIFGNTNPESEFKVLKEQYIKVHWIHVRKRSFLWRDTNCSIGNIRRYIDNTKCEKYDIEPVLEHNERTMLLVAESGVGKSTFLSYMAREIKKRDRSVWVLRINLKEHTKELQNIDFEQDCIYKCRKFLWNAARSSQDSSEVTEIIFLQAMEQTRKMIIILDDFDQISPDLSPKVEKLITEIRKETAANIWITSHSSKREELENAVGKFALTFQPFEKKNLTEILKNYWSENAKIPKDKMLEETADKIIRKYSQTVRHKNGETSLTTLLNIPSVINPN